jgi:hypothetical protein
VIGEDGATNFGIVRATMAPHFESMPIFGALMKLSKRWTKTSCQRVK